MIRFRRCAVAVSVALMSLSATAKSPAPEVEKTILDSLTKARPDFVYKDVQKTPIKDLYQVSVEHGPLLYVDKTGKHLIAGELFEAQVGGLVNLSEIYQAKERKALMDEVDDSQTILFAPEAPKATISVFTDVDCPYCQQLHAQIDQYLDAGIAVRYLAFPRQGPASPTGEKMTSAWCADDPKAALAALKRGEELEPTTCDTHPVAAQYELGVRVGVQGTPALVLEDGRMIPGLMPAETLVQILGLE